MLLYLKYLVELVNDWVLYDVHKLIKYATLFKSNSLTYRQNLHRIKFAALQPGNHAPMHALKIEI